MKSDTFNDWQLGEPLHPAPQIKVKDSKWPRLLNDFEWTELLPWVAPLFAGFLLGVLFTLTMQGIF